MKVAFKAGWSGKTWLSGSSATAPSAAISAGVISIPDSSSLRSGARAASFETDRETGRNAEVSSDGDQAGEGGYPYGGEARGHAPRNGRSRPRGRTGPCEAEKANESRHGRSREMGDATDDGPDETQARS